MKESRRRETRNRRAAGFTMVELLVVVGLIAVMAGVAIPSVAAFMRSYSISRAAKDIASEMNTARYRAIMKNVNTGVLFVVVSQNTYQWAIEDDQNPQISPPDTETLDLDLLLLEPDQVGVVKTLPTGVIFDPTGATDPAWRYDRYGGWCDPEAGDNNCPAITGFSGANYVFNDVNGGAIRIIQPDTGLSRTLRIGTGGRVIIENS